MGQIQVLIWGTFWIFFFSLNVFYWQLEEPEDPELLELVQPL